jgi:uncharacterized protein with FMN-binding domain
MRAPFVIGATVVGIVGIVAYHPHNATSAATFNAPGTHPVGGTSTNAGASTTAPSAAGSDPGTTAPNTSGAATPPTTPPTTTPPTTTPSNQASGTASGTVTQYPFGVLQVTASVSGGRITNVRTQVQSTDPRSQQIDDAALPILRQQAMSAQSANIQGVTGATYTSQAFATSLQSALGSLGFRG